MSARNATTETSRKLRDLAGVGKSIEGNLQDLGILSVPDLAASDGDELYRKLCEQTGTRQDPCVLDNFRCAVAQARNPELPVEQRSWWWWSRERKASRL